jgi:hypothetical protein
MANRARRTHPAAFRANVGMGAVEGERTQAELAQLFDVHPTQNTISDSLDAIDPDNHENRCLPPSRSPSGTMR